MNFTKEKNKTVFESEVKTEGELIFKDQVEIKGHHVGIIETKGTIVIAKGAQVKADITAKTIIISGKVIGNCKAELLEMTEGAYLKGNISTKNIKMDDNVQFEGKCTML